ncbi:hypothetical protein DACRYDRAFT_109203 [Dacryopinax primogenitus]|uniref:Uncharacterized protein n=1 Tax=Dacryopinax primogenitus (strain DJM 731) TaxID=1858805 RepID=M5FVU9_DACPD|nr:uncharacterized protein DACRYDRAFT_109203 [Dacryopinax primogenitus]EJU00484.1 hypothetical protein DACRYDRAFT_109203 [Dacryopinax primogenitus]
MSCSPASFQTLPNGVQLTIGPPSEIYDSKFTLVKAVVPFGVNSVEEIPCIGREAAHCLEHLLLNGVMEDGLTLTEVLFKKFGASINGSVNGYYTTFEMQIPPACVSSVLKTFANRVETFAASVTTPAILQVLDEIDGEYLTDQPTLDTPHDIIAGFGRKLPRHGLGEPLRTRWMSADHSVQESALRALVQLSSHQYRPHSMIVAFSKDQSGLIDVQTAVGSFVLLSLEDVPIVLSQPQTSERRLAGIDVSMAMLPQPCDTHCAIEIQYYLPDFKGRANPSSIHKLLHLFTASLRTKMRRYQVHVTVDLADTCYPGPPALAFKGQARRFFEGLNHLPSMVDSVARELQQGNVICSCMDPGYRRRKASEPETLRVTLDRLFMGERNAQTQSCPFDVMTGPKIQALLTGIHPKAAFIIVATMDDFSCLNQMGIIQGQHCSQPYSLLLALSGPTIPCSLARAGNKRRLQDVPEPQLEQAGPKRRRANSRTIASTQSPEELPIDVRKLFHVPVSPSEGKLTLPRASRHSPVSNSGYNPLVPVTNLDTFSLRADMEADGMKGFKDGLGCIWSFKFAALSAFKPGDIRQKLQKMLTLIQDTEEEAWRYLLVVFQDWHKMDVDPTFLPTARQVLVEMLQQTLGQRDL